MKLSFHSLTSFLPSLLNHLRLPSQETQTQSHSQSQSYFMTGGLPPISSSWRQAPWDSQHNNFIFRLNTCDYSPYVTSSLTRGWVCRLQLLLVLASAVSLRSESRGAHDHILLSQIRESPNFEGQVPVFISPSKRVTQLCPQALGSTKSKSKLLYDWRFTTIHFVLASSPLRLTTREPPPPQLNPCEISPYVTSSLWICLLWICLAFRQVYISHI
jgi:hypothetical protein